MVPPIVNGAPVSNPSTIATAIRIGNPASWDQAVAARDESGGLIDSVTDREILAAYRASLAGLAGVHLNPEPEGVVLGGWMPTVVFDANLGVTREALQSAFAQENADARVFFWPLSSLPMFEPVRSNVKAWDIPGRAINLPSYHDMDPSDIERVVGVIRGMVN